MTMREYRERLERIDGIAVEIFEFQRELFQGVRSEADGSFRELDKEMEKGGVPPEEGNRRLEEISRQVRLSSK